MSDNVQQHDKLERAATAVRAYLITDPAIVLATIVMATISLVTSIFDATGDSQHKIARKWARFLLWVSNVRVTVAGGEKLDPARSYVIVANHSSYMDTPVVMANIPLQFRFFAKKGLFSIPFLGTHLKRAGHVPVIRDDPRASLKTMSEGARIIRERNVSVLLFPEGGRSEKGMREFKEGAAYIAIKAGVPIVPVALNGTRAVLPMHSGQVRGGAVHLWVGDPVETTGMTVHDRGKLTQMLRESIAQRGGEQ